MRKFLIFSVIMALTYVYTVKASAIECYNDYTPSAWHLQALSGIPGTWVGLYSDWTSAAAALNNSTASYTSTHTTATLTVKYVYHYASNGEMVAGYITEGSCSVTPPVIDTDDDNIPDECDFYPDDHAKLNTYRVAGRLIEDSTQNVVAETVVTPYNDYFTTGDTSNDGSPGYTYQMFISSPDSPWYEKPADCGALTVAGTIGQYDSPSAVPYTWTGEEYEYPEGPGSTGMPEEGTDYAGAGSTGPGTTGAPIDGTDYDGPGSTGPGTTGAPIDGTDYNAPIGTESDSESLSLIAKNTAAQTDAIKLLNENQAYNNALAAQTAQNTAAQVDATKLLNENQAANNALAAQIANNTAAQVGATKTMNDNIASMSKNINKTRINAERQSRTLNSSYTRLSNIDQKLTDFNAKFDAKVASEAADKAASDLEVQQGLTDMNNLSVGDYYSDLDSTITEGVDYDEHTPLEEQGFIVSFLANNPIKAALDASGFALSSASCSMSADLGQFGAHEINLCSFASEFSAAGSILFGFTCLISIFIVARGK